MSAPKLKPDELAKLFEKSKANSSTLHDKKIVESLIQRLNENFKNDPALAKKAALILEEWIKKQKKK